MPPKGPVLSSASRFQRRHARIALGPLKTRMVKPGTLKRYQVAVTWFFITLRMCNMCLPKSMWEFDLLVLDIMDMAWQEGEPRNLLGDVLSGLGHFTPPLKRNLTCCWRLYDAWGRSELPARAPPLTPLMAVAIAHFLFLEEGWSAAVAMLVGFHCFLRTSEMLSITSGAVSFATNMLSANIVLTETKGTSRFGGLEMVVVNDPWIVRLLAKLKVGLLPGDRLCSVSLPRFRLLFGRGVARLGLDSSFKPYSARRGGATFDFRSHGNISLTMVRGRWRNQRTARIYINLALQHLGELHLSAAIEQRLTAASRELHRAMEAEVG